MSLQMKKVVSRKDFGVFTLETDRKEQNDAVSKFFQESEQCNSEMG